MLWGGCVHPGGWDWLGADGDWGNQEEAALYHGSLKVEN